MPETKTDPKIDIASYFSEFQLNKSTDLFISEDENKTKTKYLTLKGIDYPLYINEFWTSKQRQSSSLHEISYRACFKAQLPRLFIQLFSAEEDVIYDPFAGRGTTGIEAALLNRNIILNDINPLSKILSEPRLFIPNLTDLSNRLNEIPFSKDRKAEIDLSMFFNSITESEIVSIREYLQSKSNSNKEDVIDKWIRMIATNRLTGHSPGFFSVYTLPPNQATTAASQRRINEKRSQSPEYRDTKNLILRKTHSILRSVNNEIAIRLHKISRRAIFLQNDARSTPEISNDSVTLTVTSPPFLDIVQYSLDNWLRCWFNSIDIKEIDSKITTSKTINDWTHVMGDVFIELYRITKKQGWVAFEVGEIRNKKLKLEEFVIPIGAKAGFTCEGVIINDQSFTKTSNIWGIKNNKVGTNTNRIVIFSKE